MASSLAGCLCLPWEALSPRTSQPLPATPLQVQEHAQGKKAESPLEGVHVESFVASQSAPL